MNKRTGANYSLEHAITEARDLAREHTAKQHSEVWMIKVRDEDQNSVSTYWVVPGNSDDYVCPTNVTRIIEKGVPLAQAAITKKGGQQFETRVETVVTHYRMLEKS